MKALRTLAPALLILASLLVGPVLASPAATATSVAAQQASDPIGEGRAFATIDPATATVTPVLSYPEPVGWDNALFAIDLLGHRYFYVGSDDFTGERRLYSVDSRDGTPLAARLLPPEMGINSFAFDPGTGLLVGLMRTADGAIAGLGTLDPETLVVTMLQTYPEIGAYSTPNAAYDAAGGRYFFVGYDSASWLSHLYVADARTGTLLSDAPLAWDRFPTHITFDPGTGRLVGFTYDAAADGQAYVSVDPSTGNLTVLQTYPRFYGLTGMTVALDTAGQRLFFILSGRLFAVDSATGAVLTNAPMSPALPVGWMGFDPAGGLTGSTYVDRTVPVTTAFVWPHPDSGGWNDTPVNVTFMPNDPPPPPYTDMGPHSGVREVTYSATGAQPIPPTTVPYEGWIPPVTISAPGETTLTFHATDNAGNVEAPQTLTVRIREPDTIPPVTTATLSPPANAAGWHNGPVTLTLHATDNDGGSGVAHLTLSSGYGSMPFPGDSLTLTIQAQGETTLYYYATDAQGNAEATRSLTIRIDAVPPEVSLSFKDWMSGGYYRADQQVGIACTSHDYGSGLATGCADIDAPAHTFNPGSNTVTATVADNAGNTATAAISFTVWVDYATLEGLTRQFVTSPGVAKAMVGLLTSAQQAEARGNPNAKAGKIQAYVNLVNAQSGKSLTAEQAASLVRLARAL